MINISKLKAKVSAVAIAAILTAAILTAAMPLTSLNASAMIINHNIPAIDTNKNLNVNNDKVNKSLEKLSSGLKINKADDDAAGLAISEKMRGQIRGLDMATKNAQDGVALIQTAEDSMQTIENILQRMRELAVQSASDTNTEEDRKQIQTEIDALTDEINRISEQSEFNTMKLLDGSFTGIDLGTQDK